MKKTLADLMGSMGLNRANDARLVELGWGEEFLKKEPPEARWWAVWEDGRRKVWVGDREGEFSWEVTPVEQGEAWYSEGDGEAALEGYLATHPYGVDGEPNVWEDVQWEELPANFRVNYPESAENDPEDNLDWLPSFGWWPGFEPLSIAWNRNLGHVTIQWDHPTEYVLHSWQWKDDDRHEGGGYWEFWDHRARWFGQNPEDPRLSSGQTE